MKGKSKCLSCGTLLTIPQAISPSMNTFSLDEEQSDSHYSRKVKFSFTDASIDKVASVMGGHVPLTQIVNSQRPVIREQQQLLPSFQKPLEETHHSQNEELIEQSINHSSQKNSDANDPLNYFEKDGQGILISINPDYKGKNKKSQQQRFSLLYVWAYNLIHQEPVPNKEHLNQAARTNGVHDKNYSTHLNDVASRFFIKSDGTYKLNPGGQLELKNILSEMQNLEITGFEYWSQTRKNSSRGSRITKEETQKIEEWIQMQSRCETFDVRKLETAVNFALFALFDLIKELKVQEAVKPGLAYEYLIKKYQTVSVKKDNFTKALTNGKEYSKYFNRTHEGLYCLTVDAESLVEEWLNQGSVQKA
ncbi:hypothetical protein DSM107003_37680 [Trichormus variabilis SAG 1403-4b]|uniref:Uncharacterized protein n=2 Tax=Anabaena variabilis TaxID=264691 RepID=A0A433UK73_ANAVA|nr:hypothetical protein DSM107003_37680 [Trichormus variabilis SAG 1403-4b]